MGRKILVCLMMIFVLPMSMKAFAQESTGSTEIELLNRLNITEWTAEMPVTRAQFVDAVMKSTYGSEVVNAFAGNVMSFNDIPVDYWANGSLSMAKFYGVIHGTENNNFEPEGNVSFEMASKIIVNAVCRGMMAENAGGYPSGYINQASALKITKGLLVENYNELTQGEAAVMLRNLLDVKVLSSKNENGKTVYYYEDSYSETYLQKIHNVRYFDGRIITNENTSIDSNKTVMENHVIVEDMITGDSAIFDEGETDASKWLAKRAKVYYFDNDMPEIVFLELKNNQEILEIDGSQIVAVDKGDKKIRIEIEKQLNRFNVSVSKEKIEFSTEINLLHNGIFTTDVNAVFNILNGETEENVDSITMYDNDNDGEYDIASVNTYYTVDIDYTLEDENKIVLSDRISGRKFEVEKNSDTKIVKLSKEGMDYNDTAIRKGDIVSVSSAKGEMALYTLHISNETITDTPVMLADDKVSSRIAEYEISRTLITEDAVKNILFEKEYVFSLDHKGRIAGYEPVENIADNYFFINRLLMDETGNGTFIIKGCTLGGEVKTLVGTNKLIIDDTKCTEKNINYCKGLVENNLVDCKYNADGEVTKIILPSDNPELGVLSNVTGIDNSNSVKTRYKSSPKVFFADGEATVAITSNTKVLHVPSETLISQGASLRDYCESGSMSDFVNDEYYSIKAYYTKPDSVAADIVVAYNNGGSKITTTDTVIVIGKAGIIAINGEESVSTKIEGLRNGVAYEMCSANETFEDKDGNTVELGEGDIVQMSTNVYGDCVEVKMLYDHSADYVDISQSFSSSIRTMRGSIYSHDSTAFYMVKNKWDISESDIKFDSIEVNVFPTRIVVYDEEERELRTGTIADIVDFRDSNSNYSRVVYSSTFGYGKVLVIYK